MKLKRSVAFRSVVFIQQFVRWHFSFLSARSDCPNLHCTCSNFFPSVMLVMSKFEGFNFFLSLTETNGGFCRYCDQEEISTTYALHLCWFMLCLHVKDLTFLLILLCHKNKNSFVNQYNIFQFIVKSFFVNNLCALCGNISQKVSLAFLFWQHSLFSWCHTRKQSRYNVRILLLYSIPLSSASQD